MTRSARYLTLALATAFLFGVSAIIGMVILRPGQPSGSPQQRVGLQVFLEPHTSQAEVVALERELLAISPIMNVRYVSQGEAFTRAAELFSAEPDVMATRRTEEMPSSFVALTHVGTDLDALLVQVRALPGVMAVSYAVKPSRFP